MEASQEEYLNNQVMMIKGKRTKRQRPLSPLRLTIGSSNSSSCLPTAVVGGDHDHVLEWAASTPTTSINESTTTDEEEEMANCLILLAQGRNHNNNKNNFKRSTVNYQCKTCDKSFHSFQALGGHRASHKKPKPSNNYDDDHHRQELEKIDNNNLFAFVPSEDHDNNRHSNDLVGGKFTNLSLQLANGTAALFSKRNNNNNKVHECSICGADFTSGQALGGHMRKHRSSTSTTTSSINIDRGSLGTQELKRPRNILKVDLNLPAPEDHDHIHRDSKHLFSNSKEQVIVFSSPSNLIDCHY